jgi:hypothetical protein
MSRSSALTKAIRDVRQQESLTKKDRLHLDRWQRQADDPIWDDLAGAIAARGELFRSVDWASSLMVQYALRARRQAEEYGQFNPKQEHEKREQIKADLLALADKMENVVKHYLTCKTVHESGQPPPPDVDRYEDPVIAMRKQSLAWLQKDAQRIRERAMAITTTPSIPYDIGFHYEVLVRRQRRGRNRSESGVISIFVQDMAGFIRERIGKPRWSTIADLTNVAFPSVEVDEDAVRSMCKPTTREGRRKKRPVHSSTKSDKKSW